MYEISLSSVVMTSKFVMTLADMKAGDSFTVRTYYCTSDEMTLQEVEDISNIWDRSERAEIINRFKYNEDLDEGFGVVELKSTKNENTTFNETGSEVSKTFEGIVTVTATVDISSGSILKI